jgi:hypothetical protein
MVLRASPNIILPLNKHAIQTVLGVPAGTTPPPKHSYNDVNVERAKLAAALSCSSAITIDRLKAKLREHQVDDRSIWCFFLILFNRFLFSTTSINVCNTEVELTMDWENFRNVDWQQAILNNLKCAAKSWNERVGSSNNPSLSSCPPFLIVSLYLSQLYSTYIH